MVNMSGIPDGVLAPDLPPTLFGVVFSATNLMELPTDLFADTWPHVMSYVLERSPEVTEFPRALLRPDATTWLLSLAGNGIQTLPEDLFTIRPYYHLFLDRNPLTMLPENAGIVEAAGAVSVEYTAIAGVPPSWFNTSSMPLNRYLAATSGFKLAARNTPVCANLLAGGPAESRQSNHGDDGASRMAARRLRRQQSDLG